MEDRFVRSVHAGNGAPVYRDSCVELFVRPVPGRGYLNFEFNAGGSILASHVKDPTRTPNGFRDFSLLEAAEYARLRVFHSLPAVVEPELVESTIWALEFFVPFALLEERTGGRRPRAGDEWRANLFKCGDATSHPHWASWSPLTAKNFHLPECFGALRFG